MALAHGNRVRGERPALRRVLAGGVGGLIGATLWLGLTVASSASSFAQPDDSSGNRPRVLATSVDGAITPVIADHLGAAIRRAEQGGYDAVIVELDTPGGLDSSMRKIVQRFLAAELPVVVYVSPHGARAASAGAIITFAGHIAAMAPGTAIGAATPVDLEGRDVERKVVNDAAAYAESLARLRDRDVDFAVDTVREGRSASADEAAEIGAVDLVAESLPALLDEIDGVMVDLAPAGTRMTLATAGAEIDVYDMGFFRRIQQVLADPNIAFMFLSIGTLAIIYELASPGVGAGGVVGATMLLLALFSLSVLPVNLVGLLLLGLAVGLFIIELFVPGVGVAAAGGTIALLLSGIFMFDDAPGLEVSMAVVIPVAVVVGAAVVFAGRLVLQARNSPSTITGVGVFLDRTVAVRRVSATRGQAFLEGAWWTVRPADGEVREGPARVVAIDGLDLVVEAADNDLRAGAKDVAELDVSGQPQDQTGDNRTGAP